MKLEFIEAPKGRDYKVGDIVDFDGPVPESYAKKYIARGWAREYVAKVEPPKAAPKPSFLSKVPANKDDDKSDDKK